jgi:hypothetical protein
MRSNLVALCHSRCCFLTLRQEGSQRLVECNGLIHLRDRTGTKGGESSISDYVAITWRARLMASR